MYACLIALREGDELKDDTKDDTKDAYRKIDEQV